MAKTAPSMAFHVQGKLNEEVVNEFSLIQNYPNPFNPVTSIDYTLPADLQTRLVVYDVLGRVVKNLVDGVQQQGPHSVRFEAGNLASGMYVYKLTAGQNSEIRRMLLMK